MAKTASQSSEKFATRAGAAVGEYVNGAKGAGDAWKRGAKAAVANHKAAVQEALTNNSYERGIDGASATDYAEGVESKGSQRYAEGVSASRPKYEKNSAKYDTARNAASALPRGPRGSAQNLTRVSAVTTALRKVKTGK
jgi:hypothetical protein